MTGLNKSSFVDKRPSFPSRILAPPFDPVATIVRADLAYSAAGVAWSSNLSKGVEKNRPIDVDEGIRQLVRKAEVLPAFEYRQAWLRKFSIVREADNFIQWNRVFAPDSVFGLFLKPKAN